MAALGAASTVAAAAPLHPAAAVAAIPSQHIWSLPSLFSSPPIPIVGGGGADGVGLFSLSALGSPSIALVGPEPIPRSARCPPVVDDLSLGHDSATTTALMLASPRALHRGGGGGATVGTRAGQRSGGQQRKNRRPANSEDTTSEASTVSEGGALGRGGSGSVDGEEGDVMQPVRPKSTRQVTVEGCERMVESNRTSF